jgi:3-hydroxypropanoate dehydrogenase
MAQDILSSIVQDQLFRTARTFNGYTDRPVTEATLRALYDLYKWGPTSTNQQPLRVIWCITGEAKAKLADFCYPGNAEKVRAAPVTAIFGMDLDFVQHLLRMFPHADARGWYGDDEKLIAESAFRNSTLQAGYLIIAARALGLGANGMSGFDEAGVNAAFFPGGRVRVNFISTLGYGDQEAVYPRAPRFEFEEVNDLL